MGKVSGNDGKNVYILVFPHDLGCHSCRFCVVSRCAVMLDVVFMHNCIIECFRGRHRGGRNAFHFCSSRDPLFMQLNELFYLKTCTPVKGTPWNTAWLYPCHGVFFVHCVFHPFFCIMEVCLDVLLRRSSVIVCASFVGIFKFGLTLLLPSLIVSILTVE